MLRVEGNQKYLDIEIDNDDLDWLELPSIPDEVINPLDGYGISGGYADYAIDLVTILSNKNYLHFFCKHILNVELLPYQLVILDTLWNKKSPMLIGCRGAAKSFLLAVYALVRMVLTPGIKIVIVGAGLRQSRQVFDYMASIWLEAPILQDIAGNGAGPKREIDRFVFKIGTSMCFAIPIGSGDKIRGLRANIILCDEFASLMEEIFNVVVRGFASVQNEPKEKVKHAARMKRLKKTNEYSDGMDEEHGFGRNQIILSGTATPSYNHFNKYFNIWQSIILSRGDLKFARELFGNDKDALKGFNWRDYAIIRIPYTHLPEGLLDPAMLAQAKATLTVGQFNSEYGACFISDSDGFFKGSLLESATVTKPIEINGQKIQFTAQRQGIYEKRYIMGVDPAADQDNAAIVILEINPDHRKIVYCWTINKKKHTEIKKKFTIAENYYEYLAFKIKHLMQSFYIDWIIMDKNGGGRAIAESLKKKISDSDQPIYDVINPDEPKVDDEQEGLHILHLLSPTADINAEANHGMKKDFETKSLLFPLFDSVELAKSYEMDSVEKEVHVDTYEDLLYEIEDMKKELRSIVVTPSANLGKETFDTPSHTVGGKKGRTKKDRYSALLYANYLARNLDNQNIKPKEYETVGGTMQQYKYSKVTREEPMYFGLGVSSLQGNSWIAGVSNNHIRR